MGIFLDTTPATRDSSYHIYNSNSTSFSTCKSLQRLQHFPRLNERKTDLQPLCDHDPMRKRCRLVKSMENYCCVLLSNYYYNYYYDDDVNKTKITIPENDGLLA